MCVCIMEGLGLLVIAVTAENRGSKSEFVTAHGTERPTLVSVIWTLSARLSWLLMARVGQQ